MPVFRVKFRLSGSCLKCHGVCLRLDVTLWLWLVARTTPPTQEPRGIRHSPHLDVSAWGEPWTALGVATPLRARRHRLLPCVYWQLSRSYARLWRSSRAYVQSWAVALTSHLSLLAPLLVTSTSTTPSSTSLRASSQSLALLSSELRAQMRSAPSVRSSVRSILLNFGPQHPAAHGILKIGLALSGEIVTRADATFGLLHRGSEKLCEARSLGQAVPYLDRMDYVANLIQEHALVQAIEACDVSRRAAPHIAAFRVLCDELSRILNHLLTMSAICLDLGSMGPVFWAFEERELIMAVFEYLSGARMHTALYRPFGLGVGASVTVVTPAVLALVQRGSRVVNGAFVTLLSNRAFKSRASHVGVLSPLKVRAYGVSGVIARASGVCVDSRLGIGAHTYASYASMPVRTFLGRRGDVYDRFLLRVRELMASYDLVLGAMGAVNRHTTPAPRSGFVSMEGVISHFKHASVSNHTARGLSVSAVEGPKGLVGVLLVTSGDLAPYRLHVRSPVAHNLHLLTSQCNGQTFADFVATFCSMDVVLGEIDR